MPNENDFPEVDSTADYTTAFFCDPSFVGSDDPMVAVALYGMFNSREETTNA